MGEPEDFCDGCGRSLAGGDDWDISLRGGVLCRPCSESVALGRGPGPIARRSWSDGAGAVRSQWLGPGGSSFP